MFCRARLFALAALIGVLGSGGSCSRKAPLAVERLAIPPFENLSDDPSLDWVGWGLTEVIATQLTGGARIQPIRLASAREFSLVGATAVLRGYYTIAGGRIRVKASREDLTSRRTVAWFDLEDRFPEGAMGIAGALARRIEPWLKLNNLLPLVPWRGGFVPWDVVAAVWLRRPELFECEEVGLRMRRSRFTTGAIERFECQAPSRMAVKVRADKLLDEFLDGIACFDIK